MPRFTEHFFRRLLPRRLLRLLIVLLIVGFITIICHWFFEVNSTTDTLLLLMGVLGVAARFGLAEAIAAALLSVASLIYFFLPPIHVFDVEDPQNWIALAVFLGTAVVASQLSAGARQREQQAIQHQGEWEQLYKLSRELIRVDVDQPVDQQIVDCVAETKFAAGVILYNCQSKRIRFAGATGILDPSELQPKLEAAAEGLSEATYSVPGAVILPIQLDRPIGSICFCAASVSFTALQAIANLVAITLEHAAHALLASRAEAVRQSQKFKSILLDAVAHDFKTPLTSIKAASTALLSSNRMPTPEREFLSVVDQAADRMNVILSEAIQMAHIEAGSIQLNRSPQDMSALVRRATQRVGAALNDVPCTIAVKAGLPRVFADPELASIAIAHLMENAIKYSPPGSPMEVSATHQDNFGVISIADHGPGIPAEDLGRIFQRFYRGRTAGLAPGSGVGLSIVSEIARIHHGRISAENLPHGGTRFALSLPLAGVAVAP